MSCNAPREVVSTLTPPREQTQLILSSTCPSLTCIRQGPYRKYLAIRRWLPLVACKLAPNGSQEATSCEEGGCRCERCTEARRTPASDGSRQRWRSEGAYTLGRAPFSHAAQPRFGNAQHVVPAAAHRGASIGSGREAVVQARFHDGFEAYLEGRIKAGRVKTAKRVGHAS
jgi:hypothetical protein